jgi:hypothetical protein
MRNIVDESYTENRNTHFMFDKFLSLNRAGNAEKYDRTGQTTDNNMAHVRCMMDA